MFIDAITVKGETKKKPTNYAVCEIHIEGEWTHIEKTYKKVGISQFAFHSSIKWLSQRFDQAIIVNFLQNPVLKMKVSYFVGQLWR